MLNFLRSIFDGITSVVTAVLVSVGLISSPALPVTDIPSSATTTEIVEEKPVTIKPQEKPHPQTQYTKVSAIPNDGIEISEIDIVNNLHSIRIEWRTNKPTNSKIFLTEPNGSIRIIESKSGKSTRHLADITNLVLNTQYEYEIEAVTDSEAKKIMGTFKTPLQTFITKIANDPNNPSDTAPFLNLSSNGKFLIKKLVFIHDDSYCNGGYLGYLIEKLNLQYGSAQKTVDRDSTKRFIAEFSEVAFNQITFRVSATALNEQSGTCTKTGFRFTLSGSQSTITNEAGWTINFPDVVIQGYNVE